MLSSLRRSIASILCLLLIGADLPAWGLAPSSQWNPISNPNAQIDFKKFPRDDDSVHLSAKDTFILNSLPQAIEADPQILAQLKQSISVAGDPEKINAVVERLRTVQPINPGIKKAWKPELLDELEVALPKILSQLKQIIDRGNLSILIHNKEDRIGFYSRWVRFASGRHIIGQPDRLPFLALSTVDSKGNRVLHVTQAFYSKYAQSTDPEKQVVFYQALFHVLLKKELKPFVNKNIDGVQVLFNSPFATALEVLIENWEEAMNPPEVSATQMALLAWLHENNYYVHLSKLTDAHPFDLNERLAHLAADLYLSLYPAIKECMDTFIEPMDPTFLARFGYASFFKIFVHEGNIGFVHPKLIEQLKKIGPLVQTARDARIVSELHFNSRDLIEEMTELFLLLSKRTKAKSMSGILKETKLEDILFPFEFIISMLAHIYGRGGVRYAEFFLTHGFAVLVLNKVITSYEDIEQWAKILDNSQFLPWFLASTIRVGEKNSIQENLIVKLAKAYMKQKPRTPKEELNLLINFYLKEENQNFRNRLIYYFKHSELISYMEEEELIKLYSHDYNDAWFLLYLLEVLALRRPELFTPEVEEKIREYHVGLFIKGKYLAMRGEQKYYGFYRDMLRGRKRDVLDTHTTYPHHHKVRKILIEKKNPKVLILHNIADGMGDELIRNATLMQSLLDANPSLEIHIYTERPFLYAHPRVHVHSYHDLKELSETSVKYEMVVDHYDPDQNYAKGAEDQYAFRLSILDYLYSNSFPIFIRTGKQGAHFRPMEFTIDGENVSLQKRGKNVYEPIFQMCAILGLPFRVGIEKPKSKDGSLLTSRKYGEAERYWNEVIRKKNKESRPIVIFNPFPSGESAEKGFPRERIRELIQITRTLVEKGYFVLFLTNDYYWGEKAVGDDILGPFGPLGLRELWSYMAALPTPSWDGLLQKYIIEKSDLVMTVEGGIQHLAYNMGKKLILLMMKGSGPDTQWVPFARHPMQILLPIVTPQRVSAAIDRIQALEAEEAKPELPFDLAGHLTAAAI